MFSDLKFKLHPQIQDANIIEILNSNGGKIVDLNNVTNSDEIIYYICDSINNLSELENLQSQGNKIISTNIIYESIELQKPIPTTNNFPLLSRCLEGKTITFDQSVDELDKNNLMKLTRSMGGEISEDITKSEVNMNILIASKVGTLYYKIAYDYKIEILKPEWITACWENRKLQPISQHYRVPPFKGLVISVTGLKLHVRKRIEELTVDYGGEYSPDLTKRCTHLLCDYPQGLKYTYALKWGIYCVTTQWFYDCVNKKQCLDESLYFLPLVSPLRRDLYLSNVNELRRLSPTLRKKHMTQIQSKVPNINQKMGLFLISRKDSFVPVEETTKEVQNFPFENDQDESMSDIPEFIQKDSFEYSNTSNEDIRESIKELLILCDKVIENINSHEEPKIDHSTF